MVDKNKEDFKDRKFLRDYDSLDFESFRNTSKNYSKNETHKEKDNKRVYIGNLDYDTNNQQVRDIFQNYGEIVSIQIRKGFAFIEYRKSSEAILAKEKMNLTFFNGRRIIVRPALPKFESRSPSRSVSPTKRKEDVERDDKNTCFFCGKKGHWKKDCDKRQRYIEEKISSGELDRDYYGFKKNKTRTRDSSNAKKRSKSRSRSRSRRKRSPNNRKDKRKDTSRYDSDDSLSFSIPSDCSSCKRVLKEIKKSKKKDKEDRRMRYSLSPV